MKLDLLAGFVAAIALFSMVSIAEAAPTKRFLIHQPVKQNAAAELLNASHSHTSERDERLQARGNLATLASDLVFNTGKSTEVQLSSITQAASTPLRANIQRSPSSAFTPYVRPSDLSRPNPSGYGAQTPSNAPKLLPFDLNEPASLVDELSSSVRATTSQNRASSSRTAKLDPSHSAASSTRQNLFRARAKNGKFAPTWGAGRQPRDLKEIVQQQMAHDRAVRVAQKSAPPKQVLWSVSESPLWSEDDVRGELLKYKAASMRASRAPCRGGEHG